jgi:hypothetical protein
MESVMRVSAFTTGLFLTSAIFTALVAAPAQAGSGHQSKVTCLCDCPDDHRVRTKVVRRPVMRRVVRRARYATGYSGGGYYAYGQAAIVGPVWRREWHGQWQAAPNDVFIPGPGPMMAPGPMAYGPPMPAPDMPIDDRGFTGGVGYMADGGGGGGGFTDGYGQVHFGAGGSVENGPTYNGYGQSFQYNPSQAGPFHARRMGGFAPPAAAK